MAERIWRQPAGDPRVAAAYFAIERSGGSLAISTLARQLDLSRKHLNSLFKRETGLSPKGFARTIRFAAAVERLSLPQGTGLSLAALAADCGYADQAHFSRDFKSFAGETPQALRRRMLPNSHRILALPEQ